MVFDMASRYASRIWRNDAKGSNGFVFSSFPSVITFILESHEAYTTSICESRAAFDRTQQGYVRVKPDGLAHAAPSRLPGHQVKHLFLRFHKGIHSPLERADNGLHRSSGEAHL